MTFTTPMTGPAIVAHRNIKAVIVQATSPARPGPPADILPEIESETQETRPEREPGVISPASAAAR